MSVRDGLVNILADGELHSGSALAAALGVSRSAVWKQAHRLGELGLELRASGARGYRLAQPLELLDKARILENLDDVTRSGCEQLDVLGVTASTNALLAAAPAPSPGHWRGALAEFQTGGRGRRGRRWVSPFASGLCLSISWCFGSAPRDLPALSLAAGVAVCRALTALGITDLALKWPNDVLRSGAKLAGILVDVDGDSRGPLRSIIGVGLNVSVPSALGAAVAAEGGRPPAGLEGALRDGDVSRNALAAALFGALARILQDFSRDGFAPLATEWRGQDYLAGRSIGVRHGAAELQGIARGIAADGALLVEGPQGIAPVFNGDVTLRTGS